MSELSFEQMLEESLKTIRNGEVVEGTVIDVKEDEIILNIGYKADGILTKAEYSNDASLDLTTVVTPGDKMEVKVLKTKYPEGAERMLIYTCAGKEINSSMLPADAGCVVDNVETIIHIYNAVVKGLPSMESIVTVSGDGVVAPGNFKVYFGTNQRELIEAAGGLVEGTEKVIAGGPMMGFAMYTLDVPVTKITSAIVCMKKDEVSKVESSACINCGRCVEVCPSRIVPSRLAVLAERGEEEKFIKQNGLECMECGSCSYVCPAKRQLKQAIGTMRKTALANRKKK